MQEWIEFMVASLVPLAGGLLFFPVLRLGTRCRVALLAPLCVLILLSPLLVAGEFRLTRFFAAALALTVAGKLVDLHVGALRGRRPEWRAYLAYMVNVFIPVERMADHEPRFGRRANVIRLTGGLALTVCAFTLGVVLHNLVLRAELFPLEHVVKTILTMIPFYGLGIGSAALWGLLGWRARVPMRNFYLARTPAEFWRRYNRNVSHFFHEDLFKQTGGRRAPIRATLIVFLVSGLVHEYALGIAIRRVTGLQLAFFLMQGVAVALTGRIKPRGGNAAIGVILTVAFMLITSTLFFAVWNQIVPHYSDAAPAWMGGP